MKSKVFLSCCISTADSMNGMPSPIEKIASINIPFQTVPEFAASIKAEPKKVPMQGVQPIENIMPKKILEKIPSFP